MPEGGVGEFLGNVLQIGHTVLGNIFAESRAANEKQKNAMETAFFQNPDLWMVPHFQKGLKGYGYTEKDYQALRAHRSVGLLQQLFQPESEPVRTPGPPPGGPGGPTPPTQTIQAPPPGITPGAPVVPTTGAAPVRPSPLSRFQARLPPGTEVDVTPRGPTLKIHGGGGVEKATGFAALQAQRDRAVASGDYAAAAELQARIKVLTTPPAEAAAARTTAVEEAKLDPALVQQKLNVAEQANLRKIAPAGTLKMLRTKDGKEVPAGSLTNEQVLAMTKSGDLVPKQTVQDQFLSVASRLLFGEDLFTGGHGTPAGGAPAAAEPAGVPAGAGWTWTPAE